MNYYTFIFGKHSCAIDSEENVPVDKCRAEGGPMNCSVHREMIRKDIYEQDTESPTAENIGSEDDTYMDAVKRGDIEACRKMVEAKARKAMSGTKICDGNGNPKICSHVSNVKIKEFDPKKIGRHGTHNGPGFNFLPVKGEDNGYLGRYGDQANESFIYMKNPLFIKDDGTTDRTISNATTTIP